MGVHSSNPNMDPVPNTWVFQLNPLGIAAKNISHKASCVVRGGQQNSGIDFHSESLYASVASQDAIRMILVIAAAELLVEGGGYVSNAYLNGDIDIPKIIEQPTDSTGIQKMPGDVCAHQKSMYGTKQAENIWGPLLVKVFLNLKFCSQTLMRVCYSRWFRITSYCFQLLLTK